jgi:hypothetical protein
LIGGFGVSANYSYTASQVTFPAGFSNGRSDHPTLQRQAPNNWNFGLTYDKSRFSGRFAITHNDANLFQYAFQQNSTPNDPILGLKGPTGDIYLYAHTQFDVQGSYRIYKGLSSRPDLSDPPRAFSFQPAKGRNHIQVVLRSAGAEFQGVRFR